MTNRLLKFNNGYEGIVHVQNGYQASPYINQALYPLDKHPNAFRAIEQIGLFRAGATREDSNLSVHQSTVKLDGLLKDDTVGNVRQNLITMLYRFSEAYPEATYFKSRLDELSLRWNLKPI